MLAPSFEVRFLPLCHSLSTKSIELLVDYEQISLRDMDYQPRYASTGSGTAILSNRLSYVYDLRGASMTVDTGCSGSMVAVHLACQNLQAGSSRIAFAAGAGLILTPNTMMPMTALNFLSPDGKCFTFDARANGYGRGEGVGLVILKRLSDALRDNDPIRAVIRSSHLSQDGRTAGKCVCANLSSVLTGPQGITLPNPDAQMFNIRKAYEKAGLDYNQTGYIECHGTGTQAGDCAELAAISQTLSLGRDPSNPLLVGSIKPNVGHLEGAAGVAGLIKGALVVEKGQIPPNANFESGNPEIKFKEWKVKVSSSVSFASRRLTITRPRCRPNCIEHGQFPEFGASASTASALVVRMPMRSWTRGLSTAGVTGNDSGRRVLSLTQPRELHAGSVVCRNCFSSQGLTNPRCNESLTLTLIVSLR